MAKDKKSFVLYSDLLKSVDHLTNEELGILFKHILEYVNDLDPILEDRLLLTAWKPIQRSLNEDLEKWEKIRAKRAEAGAKGGKAKQANAKSAKQNVANQAVSVTVTDTVNVTDSVNEIKKELIIPEWNEFLDYGFNRARDMKKNPLVYEYDLRTKYDTWIDNGWKDNKGNVIKNWKLKLSTYFREGWIKPTTNPDNIAY